MLSAQSQNALVFGVGVLLEFLPWANVPHLATAAAIVRDCAAPSTGVMVDVWHVHRGSGSTAFDQVDLAVVRGIQLNDAAAEPAADPMDESISGRLMPGDGVIPFAELLPPLLAAAPEATIGVEVFNRSNQHQPAGEVAQKAVQAARSVLGMGAAAR